MVIMTTLIHQTFVIIRELNKLEYLHLIAGYFGRKVEKQIL